MIVHDHNFYCVSDTVPRHANITLCYANTLTCRSVFSSERFYQPSTELPDALSICIQNIKSRLEILRHGTFSSSLKFVRVTIDLYWYWPELKSITLNNYCEKSLKKCETFNSVAINFYSY